MSEHSHGDGRRAHHHGGRGDHEHGGHEHLDHLPDGAATAVFAARADLAFAAAERDDQLEDGVGRFVAALWEGLEGAGCRLVGHVKGSVTARGRGDLAFHATVLGAEPALTGGLAGSFHDAVLTLNVIVFGVDEAELSAIVRTAWSATGAVTAWRT